MKYFPKNNSNHAFVNGVRVDVPVGLKFVTINHKNELEGWSHCPICYNGEWLSSICIPVSLGTVELEDGDTSTKVFEVQ